MAFEWVAGLFQSDNREMRGLSGDHANSVALDHANPYYNFRLRHHKAEGDLIADPGLLWYTSPYVKRRSGLGTHVGSEMGEGQAGYTDALLILSRDDFSRATADWQQTATRTLQQEFDNFCRRENFNRLHPHRPLGLRTIEDGSQEMFGQSLNLNRGEFVTGLLQNLYTGPVRGSYPVIGVHLNLPGVWQGYQEVGRLHNDQLLFTLGNHWLDNFSHPSLQQAALYRLRQYPDGSFIHIINPDLQDQYQVTSTNQGGASVLTLATRSDGQPLAYIVLAVIDPPAVRPTPPERPASRAPPPPSPAPGAVPAARRPDIQMPKPPRGDVVPSIAPPMLIDEPPSSQPQKIGLGGKTIIPEALSERIFTLQERGALLQKVHFSAFMLGYDVYLGTRGELGTHVEDPAATFQVRKRTVSLVAHIDGVLIDGRPVAAGVEVPIESDLKIEVAGQKLEYRDLRGQQLDGWPYVGEIRRPASSTYMIWGEDYQIGRSRECRVVLPDEPRNDNIHWKPSVGDGATIRARTGEIPKARFYTDSIMVASEHASMDLRTDKPRVVCTARHCYGYVRRNNEVYTLYPTTSPQLPKELDLMPGDEVLIGNCLFQVGYTFGEAVAPAPAPKIELTPEGMADQVSAPNLANLDQDTGAPAPSRAEAPSNGANGRSDQWPTTPGPPPVRPGSGATPGTAPPRATPTGAADRGPQSATGPTPAPPEPRGAQAPPPERTPDPPPKRTFDDQASTTAPLGMDGWIQPRRRSAPSQTVDGPGGLPPIHDVSDPPRDSADGEPDVGGWDVDDWSDDVMTEEGVRERADITDRDTDRDVQVLDNPPDPGRADATPSKLLRSFAPPPPPPDDGFDMDISVDAPPSERRQVLFIDDGEAQFEIGRPIHLVLAGWMINGEAVCGNHAACDLPIPENRIRDDQVLTARDYFRLRVRGRKGTLEVLDPAEVEIDGEAPAAVYEDPEAHTIEIIRRDDGGERDFSVVLKLVEDRRLPDPRARFVAIDTEDPLARALVTRGLPKGAPRGLVLDGVSLTLLYDGAQIVVSDYLKTYKRGQGFHPFFVQRGTERFKTAPEDGASFAVQPGDRLVIGASVYELRAE